MKSLWIIQTGDFTLIQLILVPFIKTINLYHVVNSDCGLDKQNGYIKLQPSCLWVRHNYNFNHEELSFWLNLYTILSSKALHTCLFAVNVSKNKSAKKFLKLISLVA